MKMLIALLALFFAVPVAAKAPILLIEERQAADFQLMEWCLRGDIRIRRKGVVTGCQGVTSAKQARSALGIADYHYRRLLETREAYRVVRAFVPPSLAEYHRIEQAANRTDLIYYRLRTRLYAVWVGSGADTFGWSTTLPYDKRYRPRRDNCGEPYTTFIWRSRQFDCEIPTGKRWIMHEITH